jgi:hypothetical protein
MRSTVIAALVAAALLVSSTSAYVDFLGMNSAAHREVRDGKVHIKHEVNHTFNESGADVPEGTFFYARYNAVHSADFVFVHLNEHLTDLEGSVKCAHIDHDHEVHVANPQASFAPLFDAKHNGGQHVDNGNHILVAHPRHHCGGEAVFRRVVHHTHKTHPITGEHVHTLHTERLGYEDVFEELDYEMDSTHLPHDNGVIHDSGDVEPETVAHYAQVNAEHTAMQSAIEAHEKKMAAAYEEHDKAVVEYNADSTKQVVDFEQHRKMAAQWCPSWCKRAKRALKRAAKRLIKKATQVVKKVAAKAKKVVKNVVKWVKSLGTYSTTKSFSTKPIKYNGDVTKRFSRWNIRGQVYMAGSFYFKAGVKFRLYIKSFRLIETYAYFYGSAKAGVRATVVAARKDTTQDVLITQITLTPITFAIGPIPVVIIPKIPITAGYELTIDGKLRISALLSASGYIRQGFSYTRSRGFRAINIRNFGYKRDLSPRRFSFQIGLESHVQADLELQINFIGGPKIGVAVYAEALFENNRKCSLYLQLNAQIVIAAGAKIDLSVLGRSLYKKSWGPKSLVSYKTPVFRYCKPRYSRRRRHALALADTMGIDDGEIKGPGTEPTNDETPEETVATDLDGNFTGSVWYGYSNCHGNQRVSFQILDDDDSWSEFVATISSNITVWDSESGENKYELTNVQVVYAMEQNITAGMYAQLVLMDNATEVYITSGNETLAPVTVQPTMYMAVNPLDTRGLSVSSPALCGNVSLEAAVMTDDNSSFVIFASGESTPEPEEDGLYDKVKAKFKAVWAYAPAIGVVCVVAIVVGAVVIRQKKRSAQTMHANDVFSHAQDQTSTKRMETGDVDTAPMMAGNDKMAVL